MSSISASPNRAAWWAWRAASASPAWPPAWRFCAALFIWKNAAGFPPPADAPRAETLAGRTSLSGLFTLLRRHIKPADLAATCWREWLAGNRRDVTPERWRAPKPFSATAPPTPRSCARNPNRLTRERTALNLDQFQAATENVARRHPPGDHRPGRGHPLLAGGGAVQSARAHRRRPRPGQDAAGAHPGRRAWAASSNASSSRPT